MNEPELSRHAGWQWCTPEGAELHTLLQGMRSTFREKLEWLEEAESLTLQLRGQRESRRTVAEDPSGYGTGAEDGAQKPENV